MRALFIQHDHVSPTGALGKRFDERDYEVVEHVVVAADRFHSPNVDPSFPPVEDFDAIVPMGAPWSAYDEPTIGAWLLPELELLRDAHARSIPVLGICFGGQLLALAHGGRVAPSSAPEIGWHTVESDTEDIVPSGRWFEWHYDRWELPEGATEIARTAAASQAFVIGRNLAVQFHPELDAAMLDGWIRNGGDRKLAEQGIDEAAVRAETREREAAGRVRAGQLVDAFLDHVANA